MLLLYLQIAFQYITKIFLSTCEIAHIKLAEKFRAHKKVNFEGISRNFGIAICPANQSIKLRDFNHASFNRYLKVITGAQLF